MLSTPYRRTRVRPYVLVVTTMALLVVFSGCRTTYPPATAEVSAARSAVATAEEAGAADGAPVEFRRARQKLEQSQQAADRGDNLRARILAEQAEVDARLAEMTTRANRQQEAVEALRASIDALRQEIQRSRRAAGDS